MEYLKSASLEMVESQGFASKASTALFKQMQNDTCIDHILTSADESGMFSVLKAMIFFSCLNYLPNGTSLSGPL